MTETNQEKFSALTKVLQIVSLISGLLTIMPVLFTIYQIFVENSLVEIFLSGFVAVVLFILTVFIVRLLKDKEKYLMFISWFMDLTSADSGYRVSRTLGEYEYLSRNEMSVRREYLIKITNGTFTGIPIQYKWTGANDVPAIAVETGQILEPRDNDYRDGQQHYFLKFSQNKSYVKGDDVPCMKYAIENMYDSEGKALPYLSTSIPNPTDELTLRVIFARGLFPRNIRKLTYLHYTDVSHFSSEVLKLQRSADDKDFVEWHISHPVYGGKYVISWDFEE